MRAGLPVYREKAYHYTAMQPYSEIGQDFKFFGYFQSYRYFHELGPQLFKMINLYEQLENVREKHKGKYIFRNYVSLHFRLGDYKRVGASCHPIASNAYYMKALNQLMTLTNNTTHDVLYFFEEEDRGTIEKNITELKEEFPSITFTQVDTRIPDYEQILMMALCSDNIIANSSFSWWGAYFNCNPNKNVFYPDTDHWFGPKIKKENMDDLCPKSWNHVKLS